MKIILTIILALTFGLTVGQTTLIPDPNFEQALIDLGYDNVLDGNVLTTNISGIDTLVIHGWPNGGNISDLTGLEDFTVLEILDCRFNQLTSLDISSNTALRNLKCSNNQITSIDFSNNADLKYLDCSYNQLTSLNVDNNLSLILFDFSNNHLTSIDLSNNTELTFLDCVHNLLTSLDVSNNIYLITLDCYNNQLTRLDLSNNKALSYIDCSSNYLECLSISTLFLTSQQLEATNNPMLNCIEVDNMAYLQYSLSYNIDSIVSFSTNCFNNCNSNDSIQVCIDFEQDPIQAIPFTPNMEGQLVYSANGVDMYGTYIWYTWPGQGSWLDNIQIFDASTWGPSNMNSNIMIFGNNGVEIDLGNIPYSEKSITFTVRDITNLADVFLETDTTLANPFLINGAASNTLPTGINYSYHNNGTNYTISISGNVNSLTIGGYGNAFDNLCVEPYTVIPTSINQEPSTKEQVSIYPNPMTHSANIELPNESSAYDLKIYDMMGKLVKKMDNINGAMATLNRDNLINGVYLYQLLPSDRNEYNRATSKEQTFNGKLIIK